MRLFSRRGMTGPTAFLASVRPLASLGVRSITIDGEAWRSAAKRAFRYSTSRTRVTVTAASPCLSFAPATD